MFKMKVSRKCQPPVLPEGLVPEGLLWGGSEFPVENETGAKAPEVGGFNLAADEVETVVILSARRRNFPTQPSEPLPHCP